MACRDAEADTDPLQDSDRARGAEALRLCKERVARHEDSTITRTVGEINEEDRAPEDIAYQVYEFQLDKTWYMTKSIHHLGKEAWLKSPECAKVLEEKVWPLCLEEATKQAAVQRRRDARKALAEKARLDEDEASRQFQAAEAAARAQKHAELVEQDKIAHDAFEARMRAIKEQNDAEALARQPPPPPPKTAEELEQEAREMREYEYRVACRQAREKGLPEPPMPDDLLSPAQLEERRQEQAAVAAAALMGHGQQQQPQQQPQYQPQHQQVVPVPVQPPATAYVAQQEPRQSQSYEPQQPASSVEFMIVAPPPRADESACCTVM